MSFDLRIVPIDISSSQTCIQAGGVMRSPLLRLTYFTTGVLRHQLDDVPSTCVFLTHPQDNLYNHPVLVLVVFINPYDLLFPHR